ncbi:MAG: AMP-binding protein [Burkholderiales bacterium]
MTPTAHIDTFARDNLPPRELWPELIFDVPEIRYPDRMNCAAELLDRQVASGHGDRPAIWAPGPDGRPAFATYRHLLSRANQIAHVLRDDLRLPTGTRVLLRGPNNPMMAACWYAVMKAGCIAVATMPLLRARELKVIIDKAKVTAALCDFNLREEMEIVCGQCPGLAQTLYFNDGHAGSVEALLAGKSTEFENVNTATEDVALIAFTSGTTGQAKGTMHFHRDVVAMCDLFPRSTLKCTPNDVFCGTPPLAFTFGLGGMLCFPHRHGASTVLMEKLSPDLLLKTVQDYKATIVFTAPTFFRMMAALVGQYDIKTLKKSVSAGEALPDATRQLWKQSTGIEILDGLGSTEMIHIFISHSEQTVRRGASGHAIRGYRATILDEHGQPCPPGTIGRLAVKGPTGCRYLADERQKQYVVRGWNVTGDAYLMDADGYFFFQARTDDMIISAGYNIGGPEVEAALLEHPSVAECGVIGKPDDARGMIVKAYVVLKPGHEGDAAMIETLQMHVKNIIAPYKYPREIEFMASLPRTETGKLQRFKLRDMSRG